MGSPAKVPFGNGTALGRDAKTGVVRYFILQRDFQRLPLAELVELCANGTDPSAWEEFVRRFQPVIARTVIRSLGRFDRLDPQVTQDLVQDTFVRLCGNDRRALRSFRAVRENSFYGLLRAAAVTVVRDHIRRIMADRRQPEMNAVPIHLIQSDDSLQTEHHAEQRIELDRLDRELCNASGKDAQRNRSIFWLHHRDGWSAAEIARIPWVGLSAKGVESLLARLALKVSGKAASASEHGGGGTGDE